MRGKSREIRIQDTEDEKSPNKPSIVQKKNYSSVALQQQMNFFNKRNPREGGMQMMKRFSHESDDNTHSPSFQFDSQKIAISLAKIKNLPTTSKSTQFLPVIEQKNSSFQKKKQKIKHQVYKEETKNNQYENGRQPVKHASADLRKALPEIRNASSSRKKSSFAYRKASSQFTALQSLEQTVLLNVIRPACLEDDLLNNSGFSDDEEDQLSSEMKKYLQIPMDKSLKGDNFLDGHHISNEHRSRMVDWMIQVFRVLKLSSQTTFNLAVTIMDRYFHGMKLLKKVLDRQELHLVGLVSIFISSKYEDVIPIHMSQILRDAGHSKYQRSDVIEREKEILHVLKFNVQFRNPYEEACILLKMVLNNFPLHKLQKQDEKLMFEYLIMMSQLILHSAQLCSNDIMDMAKTLGLMSLKYMKSYFEHLIDTNQTSTGSQLGVTMNSTLRSSNLNIRADSPQKGSKKDPHSKLIFAKKLVSYYKAQYFIGEDRTKFRQFAIAIRDEFKNYCDKIYGLKNLEKSYPEFFTDQAIFLILKK
ncbi:UNKNOWN [Stylonychia lemnae]|uniref:Cyclin-like domain-containing protein n=1 Tax=Stylonychia lemnae TaxID=5949 RepID=A0A077ZVJ0_STYLE|nr:UNKNOWN [Stylonychia lemnae]|eukprot:CDW73935.1 UNKNOWN [Stylonychia lemnae]